MAAVRENRGVGRFTAGHGPAAGVVERKVEEPGCNGPAGGTFVPGD